MENELHRVQWIVNSNWRKEMKNKLLTAMALVGILCMGVQADLASYSQDFEGLNQADTGALAADGWLVFANVFDSGGGYLYRVGL